MMIAQAYEALVGQHPISLESFRSLLRELTQRYVCIKGFSSPNPSIVKQLINWLRGVDALADYEEDLDILLGVFNFHFRRIQMKGTTDMIGDLWSAAVIQTPFRPALDWIEEYCTDLPLLNCDILVKLQRKSLLPVSGHRQSGSPPLWFLYILTLHSNQRPLLVWNPNRLILSIFRFHDHQTRCASVEPCHRSAL